ncbi:hypothetical protein SBRY_40537 [Actinacidiphila bryophytorum]|uniref:Uncharacterized protein n=1 Tax=Actinacidiphila bryophytorum TaxID=1436133 RepID=A0A9W4H2W8_9ACTN|nr:hypothetical protein SBRY_40537 [Actinacidiphila bryophytorum]
MSYGCADSGVPCGDNVPRQQQSGLHRFETGRRRAIESYAYLVSPPRDRRPAPGAAPRDPPRRGGRGTAVRGRRRLRRRRRVRLLRRCQRGALLAGGRHLRRLGRLGQRRHRHRTGRYAAARTRHHRAGRRTARHHHQGGAPAGGRQQPLHRHRAEDDPGPRRPGSGQRLLPAGLHQHHLARLHPRRLPGRVAAARRRQRHRQARRPYARQAGCCPHHTGPDRGGRPAHPQPGREGRQLLAQAHPDHGLPAGIDRLHDPRHVEPGRLRRHLRRRPRALRGPP